MQSNVYLRGELQSNVHLGKIRYCTRWQFLIEIVQLDTLCYTNRHDVNMPKYGQFVLVLVRVVHHSMLCIVA